jgi:hypothetical protein
MGANSYTYAYLTGALGLLALWLLVYWRSPLLRGEMVWTGAVALLNAIPLEVLLWTKDWWHPATITGTTPGPEDFIYGFANQSVIAILYTALAVGIVRQRIESAAGRPTLLLGALPFLAQTVLPVLLVWGLGLHSSPATLAGTLIGLALILWQRRDLLPVAAGSGLAGVLLALPLFAGLDVLFPGFVRLHWYLDRLSGVTLLTAPLEDVLWYGYTAAFLGVFYKYCFGVAVHAPQRALQPQLS